MLHTIELTNQAGLQGVLASGNITLCHCGAQVHPTRSKILKSKTQHVHHLAVYLKVAQAVLFSVCESL